jgi:uridylate kinase
MPIHVFNMNEPGSISRALKGEQLGTLVKGD